jgi:hypothetical protein
MSPQRPNKERTFEKNRKTKKKKTKTKTDIEFFLKTFFEFGIDFPFLCRFPLGEEGRGNEKGKENSSQPESAQSGDEANEKP